MTKKDYELIARVFKGELHAWDNAPDSKFKENAIEVIRALSQIMAGYLATDNPRFDRDRFLEACGLDTPDTCPKYNEPVLPDEDSMCSLCGLHEA